MNNSFEFEDGIIFRLCHCKINANIKIILSKNLILATIPPYNNSTALFYYI